jgi:hypothetical protein
MAQKMGGTGTYRLGLVEKVKSNKFTKELQDRVSDCDITKCEGRERGQISKYLSRAESSTPDVEIAERGGDTS